MTEGDQGAQSSGDGGRQTLGRILQHQNPAGIHLRLLDRQSVGLRMGLLAAHILAAHPETESLLQISETGLQQGGHSRAATGGHDRLGDAGLGDLRHQADHTGPWLQAARLDQLAVVELLAGLEPIQASLLGDDTLDLGQEDPDPLPATADLQQAAVGGGIPVPGQSGFGEGPVEGQTMTGHFGLSEGAIHIPEHGLQTLHHGYRPRNVAAREG